MKISFKWASLLALCFLLAVSCQADYETINSQQQDLNYKVSHLTWQQLEKYPEAKKRLKQFAVQGEGFIQKSSVYDSVYDFTVHTNEVLLIEHQNYHLLTFPIYRQTSNGLLENLVLKSDSLSKYEAFLVEYNFNAQDLEDLDDSRPITNFQDKTKVRYLS